MHYRRSIASDTWHSSPKCSDWPQEKFLALNELPKTHEICKECTSKAGDEVEDKPK
jgi:hypothetical protein